MANQTYQLIITGNCAGQFVQNVLHYRLDDSSFANRLFSAKGLVDGFLAAGKHTKWLEMLPEEYVLMSLKARRVTDGGGPEWIDSTEQGELGTFGSGAQMSGAGPVILWFTDGGARRVGKTFLPGIGVDKVDGGEILAAAITSLEADATSFRASFNAVGGTTPACLLCIPRHDDMATRSLIVANKISKDVGQQRRRQLPV